MTMSRGGEREYHHVRPLDEDEIEILRGMIDDRRYQLEHNRIWDSRWRILATTGATLSALAVLAASCLEIASHLP